MATSAPARPFRIGDVARASGVSIDTLRFYEKQGLLGRVSRGPARQRVYDNGIERRVRFIRSASALGFSLAEIRGLLDLRVSSRTPCTLVRKSCEQRAAEVQHRIDELYEILRALERVAATCAISTEACPFLAQLDVAPSTPRTSRPNATARRTP